VHCHSIRTAGVNDLDLQYVNFAIKCIQANPVLRHLQFGVDAFQISPEMDRLLAAINGSQSLRVLSFGRCQNDPRFLHEILTKLKSKTLERLWLSDGNLSDLGPTDMDKFLCSNPGVHEIRLSRNPLSSQDIVYIASSLRHNTTLRTIKLLRHDYCQEDFDLLDQVMIDATSLNAVSDSNHYCKIIHDRNSPYHDQWVPDHTLMNSYLDPRKNRMRKIYQLLSEWNRRHENVSYLNSEGVNILHLPQIIAQLGPYSQHNLKEYHIDLSSIEVVPLSIVYAIMRGWKMREVYELGKLSAGEVIEGQGQVFT
jgi:hypothetical protein